MSLAQRSNEASAEHGERLSAGPRVIGAIDFRQLARRAATPVPAKPEAATASLPPQRALELLGEVSTALPAIMARCQALEAALAASKEKARTELEGANEVVREWQGIAEKLRMQLEASEKSVAALRVRVEAAEGDLTTVRGDAERAHQAAAEAECLSSLFQEKVIAAFGVGSAGHTILESVRARTNQMLSA